MNRNIHRQIQEQNGVDTRFPSTANLMIDSADRAAGLASEFTIVPGQQVIPGQFTRAAVAEVTMYWGVPNISAIANNNFLTVSSPVAVDAYQIDGSGNVYDISGESPVPVTDYYDPVVTNDGTVTRNPIILVNGIPTTVIPANLPILDIEGAPIDISGSHLVGETLNPAMTNGFRNVAQVMDTVALLLTNASTGKYVTFTTASNINYGCAMIPTLTTGGTPVNVVLGLNNLSIQLGLYPTEVNTQFIYPISPNIMPWRFVDIVCDQLTYCQDVKDSSTSNLQKDVLNRWYFAWSAPPTNDKYGFPILQGYQAFTERRAIGFPKQIKWDPIQTLANMKFESYVAYSTWSTTALVGTNRYIPVPGAARYVSGSSYEFEITLLLSEV